MDCRLVSTVLELTLSPHLLPSLPTPLRIPTVLPAVTGPPSQLPMASQLAHGVLPCQPAGQAIMVPVDQVDQVDQVVLVAELELELGDSVVDPEDGVQTRVVHSREETGAMVLSVSPVPGRAVPGQNGGTATSAQPRTGLAGPPALGLPVLHGQLGLLALLPSLPLPSTQPQAWAALHIPLLALATSLLKLQQQALPLHKPLAPVVLPPSPLRVVRQLQPSWASSLCFKRMDPSISAAKRMY
jgi:hypothetical protein